MIISFVSRGVAADISSMTRYLLPILALFLIFAVSAQATQQMTCAYCRKLIDSGEYVKVEGKYFHKNHFLCAYCDRPISDKRYYMLGGQYYDSSCYYNAILPKCAYCNTPIDGNYIESNGRKYHKECYDGHIALRCGLCGGIITGNYLVDDWGNKYHAEHEKNERQCRYCGRFISESTSDGGKTYSDGRAVCGICLKTAVNDKDAAERIISETADKLAAYGIKIDVDKIKLKLVDSRQMGKINTDMGDKAQGTTRFEQSSYYFGLFKERRLTIYILNGMPREEFIATAAHELMHAWLYQNAPLKMDAMLTEGSCSFASWLVLQEDQTPEAEHLRKKLYNETMPVYGEGLRRVMDWVHKNDVNSWLDYLKKNEQPPW
ncbi:hypothetical protein TRIP_C20750 [Candidatus Zixiibacteriota bacterium]|nr:hypothetical protein TRIP_C20750 [candidate division Zixibacteria bacterium]